MIININRIIRAMKAVPILMSDAFHPTGKTPVKDASDLFKETIMIFTDGNDFKRKVIGVLIAAGIEAVAALYSKPGLRIYL